MDESKFEELDLILLRKLCERPNISIEDLSGLCFSLFTYLRPLRITLARFSEYEGAVHDSFGTANIPIADIEQYRASLSEFMQEESGLYTIRPEAREDLDTLLPTTTHIAVAQYANMGSCTIAVFELDNQPEDARHCKAFMDRLIRYLQLFHEKLVYGSDRKHCKAIKQSFRDLDTQALLLDESLRITCIADAFKYITPEGIPLQEGDTIDSLFKADEREQFTQIATDCLSLFRENSLRASLFDGIGWKRTDILIRPSGNQTVSVQFGLGESSSQNETFENQQLALFTTLNPFPVIQFDDTGKILSANPSAKRTFGISIETGIFLTLFVPQYTLTDLKACIESGSIISKTSTVKEKTFRFVARGAPGLGYGLLYGIDISDRINAEKQLEESHRFLRDVIDASPNLVFVKNAEGRFKLVNQAVADIYGTTIEDLLEKTDTDFNENSQQVENFRQDDLEVIHHQKTISIKEEEITDASGATRWLQTVKKPLRTSDDNINVLGIATDITQHKKLQMQLLQAQKMEAVGQLAGGVAHDFNNLLTGILGYTNLLLTEDGHSEQVAYSARMIERAANQASQLTQKLLGFARQGKHQNIAVDIHDVIVESTSLLKRTVEENISINLKLDANTAHVQGDPIQMQQVIMNLVINARDAIQASENEIKRIDIQTQKVSAASANALTECTLQDTEYLCISIKDSGCGIAAGDLNRIFDPFFSTKAPEKGTGMGLAMVYGIVENHKGAVNVKSIENAGSEFTLLLPVAKKLEEQVTKSRTSSVKGRGQILLVDDHNTILDVTTQMLTNLGYKVVTAEDGVEALRYYEDNHEKVDLVILDMIMPRMGAKECFQRFQAINPDVRVVLSTGYVNNNKVQEILNEGMTGFVQKPYHLHELSKVVADAMKLSH